MDHHQLAQMARECAAAVNTATEAFCRAVMIYEQNNTKTINIVEELTQPEVQQAARRLQQIGKETTANLNRIHDTLQQSLPESYGEPAKERSPVAPQPVTHTPLDDTPSGPTLEKFMAGEQVAATKRQVLAETLPKAAQGYAQHFNGPKTFDEIEAQEKVQQQAPASAPAPAPKQPNITPKENVWKHFLTGRVVTGGQGTIEPGFKDLKEYGVNLDLVSTQQVADQNWASGFYSEKRDSPNVTFLFNGENFFLRVSISHRRPTGQMWMSKERPNDGWLPLDDRLMYEFAPTSDISKIYREILDWAGNK